MKNRRRDTEIRSGMPVVSMASLEVAPGDQAASLDSVLQIERMQR